MLSKQNHYISQAIECDFKAEEAFDRSVKRYFARLAADYRRLAEPAEAGDARGGRFINPGVLLTE
jgi:hypothetical protein